MTVTDADIRTQVERALDGSDQAGIDVDGIVAEIVDRYGLVDTETIDHDEYWAIVQRHDSTQGRARHDR